MCITTPDISYLELVILVAMSKLENVRSIEYNFLNIFNETLELRREEQHANRSENEYLKVSG